MQFRGTYGVGRYTLGTFYWSDLRKLLKVVYESEWALEDAWGDPTLYFQRHARSRYTMFFTGRDGKQVIGYGYVEQARGKHSVMVGAYARHRGCFSALVECGKLLVGYAFENPAVARATAMHCARNRAATLLDLRVGFRKEGICRDAAIYNGKLEDIVIMGVTRREWNARTR